MVYLVVINPQDIIMSKDTELKILKLELKQQEILLQNFLLF